MRIVFFVFAASALAVRPAAAQTCANAVREGLEQCDDGNLRNLDGCDVSCRFEVVHRLTTAQLQAQTDATCTANAFGGAFSQIALNQTQVALNASIGEGATSILLHASGLDDPTGTNDPVLELGITNGSPVRPGSMPYDGTNDRDWWYAVDPDFLDAQRTPLHRLPASLAGNVLSAGPGSAYLKFILTGPTRVFRLTSLRVNATVSGLSTPVTSTGLPPGHLAHEHLDPAVPTFDSAGLDGPETGTMCGNMSAASLALAPVPLALRTGQLSACSQGYTGANSLLDILVSGCDIGGFPMVVPTPPDAHDPDLPNLGDGPPYAFIASPSTRRVVGCRDVNDAPVPFQACLEDAAYSAYLKFTSGRVVAGDDLIHADGFEAGNLSAWSGAAIDDNNLGAHATAALAGTTLGLLGIVDDTASLFVEDTKPDDENRYRARFYFDTTTFDPGEAQGARRTRILVAFEDNPSRRLAAVVLKRQDGAYSVMGRVRQDDNSQRDTGFFPVTAGTHLIEIDWMRASGPDANDGRFVLSVDGSVAATLTGVDNSISSVDFVRMGALSVKNGANGGLKWDEFESRRMSGIGP